MTLLASPSMISSGIGRSMLLRGDAADRALVVEMVDRSAESAPSRGPWAAGVEAARSEAAAAGFSQGHSEGFEAGRIEAHEAAQDATDFRTVSAVSALGKLMDAMEERERILGDELSDHVAALALTVAEAILDRELAVSIDPGREAITRCLSGAPKGGEVVAHLNATDVGTLGDLDSVLGGRAITIVSDASVAPGDAIVHVGETRIDGQLGAAMDRVREVLS